MKKIYSVLILALTRFLLILLFALPSCLLAQRSLQFDSEKIDFEINNNRFSVNGIYSFVNRSNRELLQTIMFPFADNTDSVKVKRVFNLTYANVIRFQMVSDAIIFKLHILPKDTVKVNIAYSQKTVYENIYILESTQSWGEPLQYAYYSLTFDNSVQIDSLSLTPDTLINNAYYWMKKDFYPADNFKVWAK